MSKHGDVALEVVPRSAPPPEELPAADVGDEDEVSLREYLDVIVANRWLIAAATAAAVLIGGAYALLATPVYRSDVLVQVEQKKGGFGFDDMSDMLGESSPAETEIEILRSRALVGAVVDELRLELVARPRRFPLVGGAFARTYRGEEPRGPVLGLGAFGWGGERIALGRLELSPALAAEELTLVAGEGGAYRVEGEDGRALAQGKVGEQVSGGGLEIFVADLLARPGTEFRISRRPRDEVVEGLQQDLRISEKGKKTGVLQLALEGPDRAGIAAILDSLSRKYLRQNVERKSAEAQKTLEFLDEQLPALRSKLEGAEVELERYRARDGAVDVTLATQAALQRVVEVEKGISELQVEYAALRQKFTESHPVLVAMRDKLSRLAEERARIDRRMKDLPEAELESARRLRDVKVANELYLTLLNRAQELKVVKEGTVGNVRILDAAILPAKPVAPRKAVVVLLALFLGAAAGVAIAFARRALDQGMEDPEAIERATGLGVHASIPRCEGHAEGERRAIKERRAVPVLAATDPANMTVEALRSLRTSLQFALFEARNPIVTIGGAAPGVGKSFVTVNLAHLLGESGKRVVVVDADLRRGYLHRHLGVPRAPGVSDVLGGQLSLDEALRETGSENVRFLSTGRIPPNPAELLGSERFQRLLAELAGRFDVVLVDTPPILAVTDAALIARHAGVNLLVLKWGAHPLREVVAALRGFGRAGARVHGIVLNSVSVERGLGRGSAYHYQYRYAAASSEDDD
ncbi:polysaccharide biosynthesis tyrosine autokinase [Anaeromyxobacter sp. SG64]|uniref:polysaccharide biosynthesis tyrosine autokinase n=1 Tax=Anaeromyxobacter sp. SG64 TaxID=2925409 RepID=UPI001F585E8C|nr:polysaccharide biosynthesis tyrosine autokinase [Anaeromyxobacter sp. SG64]